MRRAFANRDVAEPQRGHRFFVEPNFEFFVRVPKVEVSLTTLLGLHIVLHRVHEAPRQFLSAEPLARQFGPVVEELGRIRGIDLTQLAAGVRPDFERILTERPPNR